jgi:hypothetical protein
MSYAATDEEIAELNKFRFDLDRLDMKRGLDRFRTGYHEVCLKGYNSRLLWDLAESLEQNGYRLVDAEAGGLTYYSPDGKTEVYLDEVSNAIGGACRIMILRGELTEGELPMAEQQLRALFYDL